MGEAAALDEHGFFVEHLGPLHGLALGGEHGGLGQPVLHQLQRGEAVVHLDERRPGELDHVHLHPLPGEVVQQRVDELRGVAVVVKRAVDEVHAQHPQRLLLADVLPVQHPHV